MTAELSNPVVAWIRGLGLALGGTITLGLASLQTVSLRDFVDHAQRAEGHVVALNAGEAHPEVEFRDPQRDQPVMFPGNGWGVSHRVGDRVAVLFRREGDVMIAKLDEPWPLWGFPMMTLGTGAALLLGGVLTIARTKRTDRRIP